ncbi:hypothetical protein B0T44_21125, partial [Nocardia donostiensis]
MAYNIEIPGWLQGIAEILNFGMEYPEARAGDMAELARRAWMEPASDLRAVIPFVRETMVDIEAIYSGEATEPLLKQLGKLEHGKFSLDAVADAMEEFGRSVDKSADGITKTQLMQLGFAAYTLYALWSARAALTAVPWGRLALPAIEAGIVAAGKEVVAVTAARGVGEVSLAMSMATLKNTLAPILARFGSLGLTPLGKVLTNPLMKAAGKSALAGAAIDATAGLLSGAGVEWESMLISGMAWGFAPLTGGPAAMAMSKLMASWAAPAMTKRLLTGAVAGQAGMVGMWAGGIAGQATVQVVKTGDVVWKNVDTTFDPHMLVAGAGFGLISAARPPAAGSMGEGFSGSRTGIVAEASPITAQSRSEGQALFRQLSREMHPDRFPEGPQRQRAEEYFTELSEIRRQAHEGVEANSYSTAHVAEMKTLQAKWLAERPADPGFSASGAKDGTAPHPNAPTRTGGTEGGSSRPGAVAETGGRANPADGGAGKSVAARGDAGRTVEGRSSGLGSAKPAAGSGGGVVAARQAEAAGQAVEAPAGSGTNTEQLLSAVDQRGSTATGLPPGADPMPAAAVREGVNAEGVLTSWADNAAVVPQWRGSEGGLVYYPVPEVGSEFEQGVLPGGSGLIIGFTSIEHAREIGGGVVLVFDAPGGFVQPMSSGGQAVVLLGGVGPQFVVGRHEYNDAGTIYVSNPGFDPGRPAGGHPDPVTSGGSAPPQQPSPGRSAPEPSLKADPAPKPEPTPKSDPEPPTKGRPGVRSGARDATLTAERPSGSTSVADQILAAAREQSAVEAGIAATGFPAGKKNPMPAAVTEKGVDMPGLFAGWGRAAPGTVNWRGESDTPVVYYPVPEGAAGASPFVDGVPPQGDLGTLTGFESLQDAQQFAGLGRIYVIEAPGGFAQQLPSGGRAVVFPGGVRSEFVVGRHDSDLNVPGKWTYVENPSFGIPYTEPVERVEPNRSQPTPKPGPVAEPKAPPVADAGQVVERPRTRRSGWVAPPTPSEKAAPAGDPAAAGAAAQAGPVTVPGHEPAVSVPETTTASNTSSAPDTTASSNPEAKDAPGSSVQRRDSATGPAADATRPESGTGPLPAAKTTRMAEHEGTAAKTPVTVDGRGEEPLLVGQCATYAAYKFELANWNARGRVGPQPVKPPPGNPLRGDTAVDIAKHVRGDWHKNRKHHRTLSELIHKVMTTPGMSVLLVIEYPDGFGHTAFARHDPEHDIVVEHSYNGGVEYTHTGLDEVRDFVRAFSNETHRVTSIQSQDGVLETPLAVGEEPTALPGLHMPSSDTLAFGSPPPQRFTGNETVLVDLGPVAGFTHIGVPERHNHGNEAELGSGLADSTLPYQRPNTPWADLPNQCLPLVTADIRHDSDQANIPVHCADPLWGSPAGEVKEVLAEGHGIEPVPEQWRQNFAAAFDELRTGAGGVARMVVAYPTTAAVGERGPMYHAVRLIRHAGRIEYRDPANGDFDPDFTPPQGGPPVLVWHMDERNRPIEVDNPNSVDPRILPYGEIHIGASSMDDLVQEVLQRNDVDSVETLLASDRDLGTVSAARSRGRVIAELVDEAARRGLRGMLLARYPGLLARPGTVPADAAHSGNWAAIESGKTELDRVAVEIVRDIQGIAENMVPGGVNVRLLSAKRLLDIGPEIVPVSEGGRIQVQLGLGPVDAADTLIWYSAHSASDPESLVDSVGDAVTALAEHEGAPGSVAMIAAVTFDFRTPSLRWDEILAFRSETDVKELTEQVAAANAAREFRDGGRKPTVLLVGRGDQSKVVRRVHNVSGMAAEVHGEPDVDSPWNVLAEVATRLDTTSGKERRAEHALRKLKALGSDPSAQQIEETLAALGPTLNDLIDVHPGEVADLRGAPHEVRHIATLIRFARALSVVEERVHTAEWDRDATPEAVDLLPKLRAHLQGLNAALRVLHYLPGSPTMSVLSLNEPLVEIGRSNRAEQICFHVVFGAANPITLHEALMRAAETHQAMSAEDGASSQTTATVVWRGDDLRRMVDELTGIIDLRGSAGVQFGLPPVTIQTRLHDIGTNDAGQLGAWLVWSLLDAVAQRGVTTFDLARRLGRSAADVRRLLEPDSPERQEWVERYTAVREQVIVPGAATDELSDEREVADLRAKTETTPAEQQFIGLHETLKMINDLQRFDRLIDQILVLHETLRDTQLRLDRMLDTGEEFDWFMQRARELDELAQASAEAKFAAVFQAVRAPGQAVQNLRGLQLGAQFQPRAVVQQLRVSAEEIELWVTALLAPGTDPAALTEAQWAELDPVVVPIVREFLEIRALLEETNRVERQIATLHWQRGLLDAGLAEVAAAARRREPAPQVELGHNLTQLQLQLEALSAQPAAVPGGEVSAVGDRLDGIKLTAAALLAAHRQRRADRVRFADLRRALGERVRGPEAVQQLRDMRAQAAGTDLARAAGLAELIAIAESYERSRQLFGWLDLYSRELEGLAARLRTAQHELSQQTDRLADLSRRTGVELPLLGSAEERAAATRLLREDAQQRGEADLAAHFADMYLAVTAIDTLSGEVRELEQQLDDRLSQVSRLVDEAGMFRSSSRVGRTDGVREVPAVPVRGDIPIADAEGMAGYSRPDTLRGLDDQCGPAMLAANGARTGRGVEGIEPAMPGEGTWTSEVEARMARPGQEVKAHQLHSVRDAYERLLTWVSALENVREGSGNGVSMLVFVAGSHGLGHAIELVAVVENDVVRVDRWDAGNDTVTRGFVPADELTGRTVLGLCVDAEGFAVAEPEGLQPRPARDIDIAVGVSEPDDPAAEAAARREQAALALSRAGITDIEQMVHRAGEAPDQGEAREQGRRNARLWSWASDRQREALEQEYPAILGEAEGIPRAKRHELNQAEWWREFDDLRDREGELDQAEHERLLELETIRAHWEKASERARELGLPFQLLSFNRGTGLGGAPGRLLFGYGDETAADSETWYVPAHHSVTEDPVEIVRADADFARDENRRDRTAITLVVHTYGDPETRSDRESAAADDLVARVSASGGAREVWTPHDEPPNVELVARGRPRGVRIWEAAADRLRGNGVDLAQVASGETAAAVIERAQRWVAELPGTPAWQIRALEPARYFGIGADPRTADQVLLLVLGETGTASLRTGLRQAVETYADQHGAEQTTAVLLWQGSDPQQLAAALAEIAAARADADVATRTIKLLSDQPGVERVVAAAASTQLAPHRDAFANLPRKQRGLPPGPLSVPAARLWERLAEKTTNSAWARRARRSLYGDTERERVAAATVVEPRMGELDMLRRLGRTTRSMFVTELADRLEVQESEVAELLLPDSAERVELDKELADAHEQLIELIRHADGQLPIGEGRSLRRLAQEIIDSGDSSQDQRDAADDYIWLHDTINLFHDIKRLDLRAEQTDVLEAALFRAQALAATGKLAEHEHQLLIDELFELETAARKLYQGWVNLRRTADEAVIEVLDNADWLGLNDDFDRQLRHALRVVAGIRALDSAEIPILLGTDLTALGDADARLRMETHVSPTFSVEAVGTDARTAEELAALRSSRARVAQQLAPLVGSAVERLTPSRVERIAGVLDNQRATDSRRAKAVECRDLDNKIEEAAQAVDATARMRGIDRLRAALFQAHAHLPAVERRLVELQEEHRQLLDENGFGITGGMAETDRLRSLLDNVAQAVKVRYDQRPLYRIRNVLNELLTVAGKRELWKWRIQLLEEQAYRLDTLAGERARVLGERDAVDEQIREQTELGFDWLSTGPERLQQLVGLQGRERTALAHELGPEVLAEFGFTAADLTADRVTQLMQARPELFADIWLHGKDSRFRHIEQLIAAAAEYDRLTGQLDRIDQALTVALNAEVEAVIADTAVPARADYQEPGGAVFEHLWLGESKDCLVQAGRAVYEAVGGTAPEQLRGHVTGLQGVRAPQAPELLDADYREGSYPDIHSAARHVAETGDGVVLVVSYHGFTDAARPGSHAVGLTWVGEKKTLEDGRTVPIKGAGEVMVLENGVSTSFSEWAPAQHGIRAVTGFEIKKGGIARRALVDGRSQAIAGLDYDNVAIAGRPEEPAPDATGRAEDLLAHSAAESRPESGSGPVATPPDTEASSAQRLDQTSGEATADTGAIPMAGAPRHSEGTTPAQRPKPREGGRLAGLHIDQPPGGRTERPSGLPQDGAVETAPALPDGTRSAQRAAEPEAEDTVGKPEVDPADLESGAYEAHFSAEVAAIRRELAQLRSASEGAGQEADTPDLRRVRAKVAELTEEVKRRQRQVRDPQGHETDQFIRRLGEIQPLQRASRRLTDPGPEVGRPGDSPALSARRRTIKQLTTVRGGNGPEDSDYVDVRGLLEDSISQETAEHIVHAIHHVLRIAPHVPLTSVAFAPLTGAFAEISSGRALTIDLRCATHPDEFVARWTDRVRKGWFSVGTGDAWVDMLLHEVLGHGTDWTGGGGLSGETPARARVDRHLAAAFAALTSSGEVTVRKRRWLGNLSNYSFRIPFRVPFIVRRLNKGEALAESAVYVRGNPESDWRSAQYALYRALFDMPELDLAEIERFRAAEQRGVARPHLAGEHALVAPITDGIADYVSPGNSRSNLPAPPAGTALSGGPAEHDQQPRASAPDRTDRAGMPRGVLDMLGGRFGRSAARGPFGLDMWYAVYPNAAEGGAGQVSRPGAGGRAQQSRPSEAVDRPVTDTVARVGADDTGGRADVGQAPRNARPGEAPEEGVPELARRLHGRYGKELLPHIVARAGGERLLVQNTLRGTFLRLAREVGQGTVSDIPGRAVAVALEILEFERFRSDFPGFQRRIAKAATNDVAEARLAHADVRQMWDAIAGLRTAERKAVLLRYAGMSFLAVAEVMDCGPAVAESMLRRGVRSIVEALPPAPDVSASAEAAAAQPAITATLADVARAAGVTISTVHLAVNDRQVKGISAETKQRVRRIAADLGYPLDARKVSRPDGVAQRRTQLDLAETTGMGVDMVNHALHGKAKPSIRRQVVEAAEEIGYNLTDGTAAKKRVTLDDVAREAGVSRRAAGQVLRNETMPPGVTAAVMAAVAETGYEASVYISRARTATPAQPPREGRSRDAVAGRSARRVSDATAARPEATAPKEKICGVVVAEEASKVLGPKADITPEKITELVRRDGLGMARFAEQFAADWHENPFETVAAAVTHLELEHVRMVALAFDFGNGLGHAALAFKVTSRYRALHPELTEGELVVFDHEEGRLLRGAEVPAWVAKMAAVAERVETIVWHHDRPEHPLLDGAKPRDRGAVMLGVSPQPDAASHTPGQREVAALLAAAQAADSGASRRLQEVFGRQIFPAVLAMLGGRQAAPVAREAVDDVLATADLYNWAHPAEQSVREWLLDIARKAVQRRLIEGIRAGVLERVQAVGGEDSSDATESGLRAQVVASARPALIEDALNLLSRNHREWLRQVYGLRLSGQAAQSLAAKLGAGTALEGLDEAAVHALADAVYSVYPIALNEIPPTGTPEYELLQRLVADRFPTWIAEAVGADLTKLSRAADDLPGRFREYFNLRFLRGYSRARTEMTMGITNASDREGDTLDRLAISLVDTAAPVADIDEWLSLLPEAEPAYEELVTEVMARLSGVSGKLTQIVDGDLRGLAGAVAELPADQKTIYYLTVLMGQQLPEASRAMRLTRSAAAVLRSAATARIVASLSRAQAEATKPGPDQLHRADVGRTEQEIAQERQDRAAASVIDSGRPATEFDLAAVADLPLRTVLLVLNRKAVSVRAHEQVVRAARRIGYPLSDGVAKPQQRSDPGIAQRLAHHAGVPYRAVKRMAREEPVPDTVREQVLGALLDLECEFRDGAVVSIHSTPKFRWTELAEEAGVSPDVLRGFLSGRSTTAEKRRRIVDAAARKGFWLPDGLVNPPATPTQLAREAEVTPETVARVLAGEVVSAETWQKVTAAAVRSRYVLPHLAPQRLEWPIRQIAYAAGVSKAPVQRVRRGLWVSPDIRARVIESIQQIAPELIDAVPPAPGRPKRKATKRDVAAAADVSYATVNRVFANQDVAPQLWQQVLAAADRLGVAVPEEVRNRPLPSPKVTLSQIAQKAGVVVSAVHRALNGGAVSSSTMTSVLTAVTALGYPLSSEKLAGILLPQQFTAEVARAADVSEDTVRRVFGGGDVSLVSWMRVRDATRRLGLLPRQPSFADVARIAGTDTRTVRNVFTGVEAFPDRLRLVLAAAFRAGLPMTATVLSELRLTDLFVADLAVAADVPDVIVRRVFANQYVDEQLRQRVLTAARMPEHPSLSDMSVRQEIVGRLTYSSVAREAGLSVNAVHETFIGVRVAAETTRAVLAAAVRRGFPLSPEVLSRIHLRDEFVSALAEAADLPGEVVRGIFEGGYPDGPSAQLRQVVLTAVTGMAAASDRPTYAQIAELAGVNVAAVANTFNGRQVRSNRLRAVLAAALSLEFPMTQNVLSRIRLPEQFVADLVAALGWDENAVRGVFSGERADERSRQQVFTAITDLAQAATAESEPHVSELATETVPSPQAPDIGLPPAQTVGVEQVWALRSELAVLLGMSPVEVTRSRIWELLNNPDGGLETAFSEDAHLTQLAESFVRVTNEQVDRKPTQLDVARLAGVDKATVSRVLRRPGAVHTEQEQRTLAAAILVRFPVRVVLQSAIDPGFLSSRF